MNESEPPPPASPRTLPRVIDVGPTAQPLIAGALAWIVTVAPVGYAKHAPFSAGLFATLALLALLRGAVTEWMQRREPTPSRGTDRNRMVTLVSFALLSTIAWLCDSDALSPIRMSAARGVAGVLGWLLFAFACAAPAVEPPGETVRVEAGPRARGRVARGDAIFVGVTALLAVLLQAVGWTVAAPERAVLVRLVTVVSAVALLGAVGVITSSRHGLTPLGPRGREAPADLRRRGGKSKRRVPLGSLFVLVLVLAAGVLYAAISGGD